MEQDDETEELVQAFRPVHKDHLFPTTPAAVAHVAIHTDPSNGRKIILWDDILHGFKDAAHARHGIKIIPFIKGPDFKKYAIGWSLPRTPFEVVWSYAMKTPHHFLLFFATL